MSHFKIGQEIVAIKNHSQGFFKKGDIFVLLGISQRCCYVGLNIGMKCGSDERIVCNDCNIRINSGVLWFCSSVFAPIISDSQLQEMIGELPNVKDKELIEV